MRGGLWSRMTKLVAVILVVSLLWVQVLQFSVPSLPHDPKRFLGLSLESAEPDPAMKSHIHQADKFLKVSVKTAEPPVSLPASRIQEILDQIYLRSLNETILNEEIFGAVQFDTLVIVIQVHNRLDYLRQLIVSLAQSRGISGVLLVFSHDYYDEDINQLVTSVDFCKVMQIFYPHSLQTHSNIFPGESPGDCPRDVTPEEAVNLHCTGNPDLYKHYREARFTQTKHHWWWKANKIYDGLRALHNHTGLVVFLEEDHFVVEDFVHMLLLLQAALPQACPNCSLITLGNYAKTFNYLNDAKKVEVMQWVSSKHNMGFAMNHSVWQQIKSCTDQFCNHDDYNWDWSLQHVSATCLKEKLFTVIARAPRVVHIGECGVHHKKKDCTSSVLLKKLNRAIQSGRRALFPSRLLVVHSTQKKVKIHKGNGGWGDERDHSLCRSFSENTTPINALVLSHYRINHGNNHTYFSNGNTSWIERSFL